MPIDCSVTQIMFPVAVKNLLCTTKCYIIIVNLTCYSTISGNIWVEAFRKHITLMYMDNRYMI